MKTGDPANLDFAAIREEFPRASDQMWLGAAEYHPYSIHHVAAMERYRNFRTFGPGSDRHSFTPEMQAETKARFARLINAKPGEIAFVQSTTDGENIVLAGLGVANKRGNIVIDDLHFEASKFIYTQMAEKYGFELRVVNHKEWQVDLADVEAAVDDETILLSVALVSQVNGYKANMKGLSQNRSRARRLPLRRHYSGSWLYAHRCASDGNRFLRNQHV